MLSKRRVVWLSVFAHGALNFVLVTAWIAVVNEFEVALGLLAGASLVSLGVTILLGVYIVRSFRRSRAVASRNRRARGRGAANVEVGSERVRDRDALIVEGSPYAERIAWLAEATAIPRHLTAGFGAASRSPVALDILSMSATRGRHDWQSLRELIDGDALMQLSNSGSGVSFKPSSAPTLVQIARLLISNQLDPADPTRAAKLLSIASSDARLRATINQRYMLELVVSLRSGIANYRQLSAQLLHAVPEQDVVRQMIVADLLNPHSGVDSAATELEWQAWVNGVFTHAGLEPIKLDPPDGSIVPFDRLASAASGVVVSDALVTVIMSSYKPDAGIRTAVRAMIAQSWTNWELLVVDDGSPAEYSVILDEVEQMDDRVTVIRNSDNRGTYVCRNQALKLARGDFVTMQDSDDWVHPRRIEIQANHLARNPKALANTCQSVRVSEQLMFAQPRGTGLRITESSIFFRRVKVIELIGGFDPIRRAADGEFRMRLEAATGMPVPVVDLQAPLSLVRYDSSSLSGSDLRQGWMHPARVAYKSAHREWRRQRGTKRLHMPFEIEERPFPANSHLTGLREVDHELDVVFLLDPTGRPASIRILERSVREMKALVERGYRVAVRSSLRIDSPSGVGVTHRLLQELINSGVVSEVLSTEGADTRVLVVRDEQVLVGVSPVDRTLKTQEVLLVRTDSPLPLLIRDEALRLLCGQRCVAREVVDGRVQEGLVDLVESILSR